MSLMKKLLKTGSAETNLITKSESLNNKDITRTPVPMINLALSGKLQGGLTTGLTTIAGKSKHFKSNIGLLMVSAYMKKHQDAICLFYDSEFGASLEYFESFGIDGERVIHIEIENIEEFKFDIVKKLNEIKRGDKVIIFGDSVGNLASKKEIEDAIEEKGVADMTRAKMLKSVFRIITPMLHKRDIPMIAINHVYDEQKMHGSQIVSGGCVVEGTLITMADGTTKAVDQIQVGEEVLTMVGAKPVTHVWNPETLENGEPECFEIVFSDGLTVTCSDKHKLLVMCKDIPTWVEAKHLYVNESIVNVCGNNTTIKSIKPVGKKKVFDLSVQDVEHYVFENGVVSHNTGIYYSSDTIFIMGRRQIKEGTEVVGYEFIINTEKSRFIKEKRAFPITVKYDGGVDDMSGLFDMAKLAGIIEGKGWYTVNCLPDKEKKYRKTDFTKEMFEEIFKNSTLTEFIENAYSLSGKSHFQSIEVDEETGELKIIE